MREGDEVGWLETNTGTRFYSGVCPYCHTPFRTHISGVNEKG